MKTALVLGAGGFIGSHLVRRLKTEGFWIRGVDLKFPEFVFTVVREVDVLWEFERNSSEDNNSSLLWDTSNLVNDNC